jgi:hypothetical protein
MKMKNKNRFVLLLRSKKHPPRQTRTHFFLFFVICSALGTALLAVLPRSTIDLPREVACGRTQWRAWLTRAFVLACVLCVRVRV